MEKYVKTNLKRLILGTIFVIAFIFSVIGVLNVKADTNDVSLESVTIEETSEGMDATITDLGDNQINIDATFHHVGDYVIYKMTFVNHHSLNYTIKMITDNNSSSYMVYEYDRHEDEVFAVGDTLEVLVKAIYQNEVTDLTQRNQNENVNFSISLTDGIEDTHETILINPSTFNPYYVFILIAFISVSGLITVLFKKQKHSTISFLLLFGILLIPLITKALSFNFVTAFRSEVKYYDKMVAVVEENGEETLVAIPYNTKLEEPPAPSIPGYSFGGWYSDGQPYDFDSYVTEDVQLEAMFTPITYHIDYDYAGGSITGTNPTTYTVETDSFDLINPTLQGYTFAGWTGSNGSSNQTRVTIEKGSTGDKSYVAHYSANQNTPYKVIHKYRKLDNTWEVDEEDLTGPTGEQVTPALKPRTGFVNPSTQQITILGSGNASVTYEYERQTYQVTLQNTSDIETTATSGTYRYGDQITLTAKNKEHYTFTKWSNNVTDNPYTHTVTGTITLSPIYTINQYTATFDSQGGTEAGSITKDYNSELGTLPVVYKEDYMFDGWYTSTNYQTQISASTKLTGNVTYYAKWKATVAIANITNTDISVAKGSTANITITNASQIEEDYTFTSDDTSVATVSSTGVITGVNGGTATITIEGVDSHKTKTVNVTVTVTMYNVYFDSQGGEEVESWTREKDTQLGTLPTTTKEHFIFDGWYTEDTGGVKITSSATVTQNVIYYAHWKKSIYYATVSNDNIILTREGTETITITNTAELGEAYTFTSNNTSIATVNSSGLVTAVAAGTTTITITGSTSGDTKTINVSVNAKTYTIQFNSHDGDAVDSIVRAENTAVGTLPTTSRQNYIFDGWYTTSGYTTQVTAETLVTGNTTYHAKWRKSIGLATITNSSMTLTNGDSESINISNANEIEEAYTFTSNNTSIATVSNAGLVTAVGSGTTTITIRGSESEIERTVSVAVNVRTYTVKFNSHDGSLVDDKVIEENTAIGELPIPTKGHYIFDGWYTTDSYTTKVTAETVITGNVTYHAKWKTSLYYATITNSTISIKRGTTQAINISNANSIEEAYTFTSNDTSIATVNSSGVITAVGEGSTTITITGSESGETKTVNFTSTVTRFTISFDSQGGSEVDDIIREEDQALGTLPTPTKEHYILDGWYTADTGGVKINSSATATQNITYYAHWNKSIYFASISNGNMVLTREDTETINITNSNQIGEAYTFTSNNTNIATVNSSGLVTAVAAGTTYITITGSTSGETVIVNVTVNAKQFTINFNAQGGSSVDPISRNEGEQIGSLPTPTYTHYILDGWYTAADGGVKITPTATVTQSVTYFAHWNKSIYFATLSNDSLTLTREDTATITITNSAQLGETYTFASDDTSVATVNSSGVVTAVGAGNATITITGSTSGETKTVSVTVNPKQYTVEFNTHDGTAVSDATVDENTTIGTLPTTTRTHYIFDGWYTTSSYTTQVTTATVITGNTTFHAKWNKSIYHATITNSTISILNGGTATINISNSSEIGEAYTFATNDSTVATVDSSGVVTATGPGTTTITITGSTTGETKTVTVLVDANQFVVTFNSMGGSQVEPITRDENDPIGDLPTTTKDHYIFDGWYTAETGGVKITSSATVTQNVEYFAHWKKSIYFANMPGSLLMLTRGDTETFVFTNISDIGEGYTLQSTDTSVVTVDSNGLITAVGAGDASIIATGTISGETKTLSVTVSPKQYTVEFNTHDGTAVSDATVNENTAIGTLPTTTRTHYIFGGWYTTDQYSTQVTTATVITGNTTFHAKWNNSVYHGTLASNSITLTKGNTTTIQFTNASSIGEAYTFASSDTSKVTVDSSGVVTGVAQGSATITITGSTSGETKTVTVTVNLAKYTVQFDSQGGTSVADVEKTDGETIGTLPTPTYTHYILDGWYTEAEGGVKITSSATVTQNVTYYAHWKKSIYFATITNSSISIAREATATINISNTAQLGESYTFTSNDTTKATVNSSTGVVTGVAVGSTTITMTGSISGETKTINITVTPKQVTVQFNTHDGTAVNDVTMDENTAIGTLPTTTRTHYIFDGWYTTDQYSTQVTAATVVTTSTTYHAKWNNSVYHGTLASNNVSVTRGNTTTISFTNASSIGEAYTFASSDTNVATVNSSTGVVTGVAVGTSTITITGSTSGETKTVTVTVSLASYTVQFDSQGGELVPDVSKTDGETIGTLPTPTYTHYILEGWYTEAEGGTKINSSATVTQNVIYYAHWSKSIYFATLSSGSISVNVGSTETISITNSATLGEGYTFSSDDTNVATVDSSGLVTGVGAGTATITITGSISGETQTVSVTVSAPSGQVTVTFNTHGGSAVSPVNVTPGSPLGVYPTTSQTDYYFNGWFTEETDGVEVDQNTVINSSITVHAQWSKLVCKKATTGTLHTVSNHTYGNIPGDTLQLGNAYDCDVNGDDDYTGNDSYYKERFYYMWTNDGRAVLVGYNNIVNNEFGDMATYNGNDYEFADALVQLPTTSTWSNLPHTFTLSDNSVKPARLITREDLHEACGVALTGGLSANSLNSCIFLFENTKYDSSLGRTYFYIDTYQGTYYRVKAADRSVVTTNATSHNSVRAAIEVPINLIEGAAPAKYLIQFDSNGGTSVPSVRKEAGSAIGTLPTPTYTHYILDGWYTEAEGGVKITSSATVTQNVTYYAHWKKDISLATLASDTITVSTGGTDTITITNVNELGETYSFASSNSSIATVNSATGEVTGVSAGSTTVTITGTTSGETKTVTVVVSGTVATYAITFDTNGGTSISGDNPRIVESGQAVGTLPNDTTLEHHIFDGWYTERSGGTQINASATVTQNVTYYAHWKKAVSLITVSSDPITVAANGAVIINITNASEIGETYTFASSNSSIATVNSTTGEVTGVTVGNATITITGDLTSETKTVSVEVTAAQYTVTFYSQGGSNISPITVTGGSQIGTLPTPTKENYAFVGWFDDPDNGNEITASTVANSNIDAYAHWLAYLCNAVKSEANLASELCNAAAGKGCKTNGYAAGDKITYGTLAEGAPEAGNAYDCIVYWDDYDYVTERFYFLRNNNGNGVLLSAGILDKDTPGTFSLNDHQLVYTDVINSLPTDAQWNNLPTSFTIANPSGADVIRPARIPSVLDITTACDVSPATSNGDLYGCEYVLQNTGYAGNNGRSAVWLESDSTTKARYRGDTGLIDDCSQNGLASKNSAKVVIEVPMNRIETVIVVRHTIQFDSEGGSSVSDMSVRDGFAIGDLPTPTKADAEFIGWYTDTTWTTRVLPETIITSDMTLHAKWGAISVNFPYVFRLDGECQFNGSGGNITGSTCIDNNNHDWTSSKYIDTGISLYSTTNYLLDYEVGFTISTYNASANVSQATLFNTKNEASGYPGLVFRKANTTDNFEISSRVSSGANATFTPFSSVGVQDVRIYRIMNTTTNVQEIYYSINGGSKILINDLSQNNPTFDRTAWFGATPTAATGTSAQRYFIGTLSNMYIRLGTHEDSGPSSYRATFDAMGGTVSPSYKDVPVETAIGELPTPTKTGNVFVGWYTDPNGGVQVNSSATIGSDVIYYARYITSVEGATLNTDNTLINMGGSRQIVLSDNVSQVEPYSFTSNNTSIVTVDNNGIVSAVATGSTTVTVTGNTSNTTQTVDVTVMNRTVNPASFNIDNAAIATYYANKDTWNIGQDETTFMAGMDQNFSSNNCICNDGQCQYRTNISTSQTTYCDKPLNYNTNTNTSLKVYTYDLVNDSTINEVAYTRSSTGYIYNMIPGYTYYWVAENDPTQYGFVTASGHQRLIDIQGTSNNVRNVRDLGGLRVDVDGDGTVDGTLKYEKLIRAEKLWTDSTNVTAMENLGMTVEYDLRSTSEIGATDAKMVNYKNREMKHYQIDYTNYLSYYNMDRAALIEAMEDIVNGESIYFHCRIGADRTGTMAYILEGLLGVIDEDRFVDYELSYYAGLVKRNRYYYTDPQSGVSKTEKFGYMYGIIPTNAKVYEWFMLGSTDQTADDALITKFRSAMIDMIN